MRPRTLAIACLIVAVGAAVFWSRRPETQPPVERQARVTLAEGSTAKAVATEAPNTNIATREPGAPAPDAPPDKIDAKQPFRVDSAGKLILDEQTRLNMEALFAQTARADLPEAQQNATATLPPAAATEAAALLERYDNYSKAQRQSYPPGIAPATEEAALAELDGLHALRVAHFGPEAAKALYGAEEDTTRSLIDLMRLEKDQSLTLPEKAERAQKLHDESTAGQPRLIPAALGATEAQPTLVVLDMELTGDLGGPQFVAEHEARLKLANARLQEKLAATGLFRLIDTSPARATIDRLKAQHRYLHDCNGCDLEIGRQLGADQIFLAWVNRVSGLILTLTYEIHDVKSGQIAARKSFDFRGDTDVAWTHAIDYMVRDIQESAASRAK